MKRVLMSCGVTLAVLNTAMYFTSHDSLKHHGRVQLIMAIVGVAMALAGACMTLRTRPAKPWETP